MIPTLHSKSVVEGEFDATPMNIEMNAQLFKILSQSLYECKERAVIQELAANSLDACRAIGTDRPIEIELPTEASPELSVTDYGVGMSLKTIIDNALAFGNSTKTFENISVGGFGIGLKSLFSISDHFIVQSYKDGVYSEVLAVMHNGFPASKVLVSEEREMDEASFTRISAVIGESHMYELGRIAKTAFRYWDYPVKVDGELVETFALDNSEFVVFPNPDGSYSYSAMLSSVIVGGFSMAVPQALMNRLELKELRILGPRTHYTCIADIGELEISPSRERIEDTPENYAYLQAKIDESIQNLIPSAIAAQEKLYKDAEPLGNLLEKLFIDGSENTNLDEHIDELFKLSIELGESLRNVTGLRSFIDAQSMYIGNSGHNRLTEMETALYKYTAEDSGKWGDLSEDYLYLFPLKIQRAIQLSKYVLRVSSTYCKDVSAFALYACLFSLKMTETRNYNVQFDSTGSLYANPNEETHPHDFVPLDFLNTWSLNCREFRSRTTVGADLRFFDLLERDRYAPMYNEGSPIIFLTESDLDEKRWVRAVNRYYYNNRDLVFDYENEDGETCEIEDISVSLSIPLKVWNDIKGPILKYLTPEVYGSAELESNAKLNPTARSVSGTKKHSRKASEPKEEPTALMQTFDLQKNMSVTSGYPDSVPVYTTILGLLDKPEVQSGEEVIVLSSGQAIQDQMSERYRANLSVPVHFTNVRRIHFIAANSKAQTGAKRIVNKAEEVGVELFHSNSYIDCSSTLRRILGSQKQLLQLDVEADRNKAINAFKVVQYSNFIHDVSDRNTLSTLLACTPKEFYSHMKELRAFPALYDLTKLRLLNAYREDYSGDTGRLTLEYFTGFTNDLGLPYNFSFTNYTVSSRGHAVDMIVRGGANRRQAQEDPCYAPSMKRSYSKDSLITITDAGVEHLTKLLELIWLDIDNEFPKQ